MAKRLDEEEILRSSYTKYEDPLVSISIGRQLAEISRRILRDIPDLVALFLIGGYARGEGSVLLRENGIVPLGDYDFLAITSYPHLHSSFPWLEDMRKRFRVQYHIGVSPIWKPLLPFLGRRIYWYEAKFGSRLLYGDGRVLDMIPIKDGSKIDLSEGFSLIFNRLMGLLQVFNPTYIESCVDTEERQHLIFQSVKVILSCGESLLLLNRKYHFSYEARSRRLLKSIGGYFGDLFQADPSLRKDYEKATNFKLKPDFETYEDPVKLWFTAKQHALEALLFYARRTLRRTKALCAGYSYLPQVLLGSSKPNALDFIKFNWNSVRYVGSLGGVGKVGASYADVVRASICYLTLSMQEDGSIREELLDKALKQVEYILPTIDLKTHGKDLREKWRLARDAILFAWTLVRQ